MKIPNNHTAGAVFKFLSRICCRNFTFSLSSSFRTDGVHVLFLCRDTKSVFQHVFKLCQSQQTIYFSAEDEELQLKWMEILAKAAKGETEDVAEGLSSP